MWWFVLKVRIKLMYVTSWCWLGHRTPQTHPACCWSSPRTGRGRWTGWGRSRWPSRWRLDPATCLTHRASLFPGSVAASTHQRSSLHHNLTVKESIEVHVVDAVVMCTREESLTVVDLQNVGVVLLQIVLKFAIEMKNHAFGFHLVPHYEVL